MKPEDIELIRNIVKASGGDEQATNIISSILDQLGLTPTGANIKAQEDSTAAPAPTPEPATPEPTPTDSAAPAPEPTPAPTPEPTPAPTPTPEPAPTPTPEPTPTTTIPVPIGNPALAAIVDLLNSKDWPAAVDPSLICDPTSDADKMGRAEGILELLIEENLKGKKFLDFGCGEGHVSFKALDQAPTISVGFDPKASSTWASLQKENLILTDNYDLVKQNGPYNVILLYDVIDHTTGEKDILDILTKVKDLLDDTGRVYLRAHPFCSRHATHLYQKLNKAYVHLVLTDDELKSLGFDVETNAKVVYPVVTYEKLIKEAGLVKINGNILRQRVDQFFKKTVAVKQRLCANFPLLKKNTFPEFQCEQQFLDYILRK